MQISKSATVPKPGNHRENWFDAILQSGPAGREVKFPLYIVKLTLSRRSVLALVRVLL